MNPLLALRQCGQSVWLDHNSRRLITGEQLRMDGITAFAWSYEQLTAAVGKKRREGVSSRRRAEMTPVAVFTVGHSTRTIEEFVHLLKAHGIQHVIDVRSSPRSRHNPQFSQDQLPAALQRFGIGYSHAPGLGGRRQARGDSTNTGWRNASFRGYADYMETPAFKESLNRCIALAHQERVALMCAEAVPWRCHRSLIADALLARGVEVSDITNAMHARRHSLTPWARIHGTDVTYPRSGFETDQVTSTRMGNGRPLRG